MTGQLEGSFPVYVIPPVLSLLVGITMAVVSVVRGRFGLENVLFALLLIWFNIMPPLFILHHVLRGQFDTLLVIEKTAHCIYVFLPFIVALYIWKGYGYGNWLLATATFVTSAVISGFVWTQYYFTGFHIYSWGYIAKGGIAFHAFSAYAGLTLASSIVFFSWKYARTVNQGERLKMKYIILSFILIGVLTAMNIPAMNGIDFYAFGNFMFVPMLILSYGVLKHRLMEIRSILHITLMWAVVSSLIIIPNAIAYYFIRPYWAMFSDIALLLILAAWFAVNFIYFRTIQPAIDQLFNRRKYNLRRIEAEFIESISYLRSLGDLIKEYSELLTRTMTVKKAEVLFRSEGQGIYRDIEGQVLEVPQELAEWFIGANHLVERGQIVSNPYYEAVIGSLESIFDSTGSEFMVPLVQNFELVGVVLLGEKFNLQRLTANEVNFINGTRSAVAISISNSLMYQNLSDLKDNLEIKVRERTEELQVAMDKLETTNRKITVINEELKKAQGIAAFDMKMAANVQASFLPKVPPKDEEWDVAFEFRPMSGVSGDFYDFFEKDGRFTGLSLFDVSGHGIASGLITMIGRSVLARFFLSESKDRLHEMLARVNDELIRELGNVDNYLTGLVMRFKGDVVEYVNAGHPDIFYRKASDGIVRAVAQPDTSHKGSIIGVAGMNPELKTVKFKIEKDDILVCATDCLYESVNAKGEVYGDEKIMEALSRAPYHSAKHVLDYLIIDFNHFMRGKPLEDDLTVLVIKRR